MLGITQASPRKQTWNSIIQRTSHEQEKQQDPGETFFVQRFVSLYIKKHSMYIYTCNNNCVDTSKSILLRFWSDLNQSQLIKWSFQHKMITCQNDRLPICKYSAPYRFLFFIWADGTKHTSKRFCCSSWGEMIFHCGGKKKKQQSFRSVRYPEIWVLNEAQAQQDGVGKKML